MPVYLLVIEWGWKYKLFVPHQTLDKPVMFLSIESYCWACPSHRLWVKLSVYVGNLVVVEKESPSIVRRISLWLQLEWSWARTIWTMLHRSQRAREGPCSGPFPLSVMSPGFKACQIPGFSTVGLRLLCSCPPRERLEVVWCNFKMVVFGGWEFGSKVWLGFLEALTRMDRSFFCTIFSS